MVRNLVVWVSDAERLRTLCGADGNDQAALAVASTTGKSITVLPTSLM